MSMVSYVLYCFFKTGREPSAKVKKKLEKSFVDLLYMGATFLTGFAGSLGQVSSIFPANFAR